MGGDVLAKKQYRQEAIRRWRLKKMKTNLTVNYTTYMDIQSNVVSPHISALTLDASGEQRRQESIEKCKPRKDTSESVQPSVTFHSDTDVVRHHYTIEPIDVVQRTGLYDSEAGSSNASNLRKRVNETLNDIRIEQLNCKRSKKTHLRDGRNRLTSIPLAPAVLRNVPNCPHCLAKKFEYETYNLCCLNGDVCLATNDAPLIFQELYTSLSLEANLFRTCIRTINNHFAFTSMGVHYDKALSKRNNGIYTFRVQGQIYHFIDNFFESKNLQLYFHDTDTEVAKRLEACPRLTESLIEKILTVLQHNPYEA
ncbi:ATP synthase gamma chain [Striga asiatica]|uniref:ATP synthase gamma chain n=1 Tax=Striga asiatica TaxID=4170 RepID=A0A5A7R9H5_STRAF|nr:ATP synthase gamma chain [Striga asiatica]